MCQSPAIPAKGECTISLHHSGCQFPYLGPSSTLVHEPCQLIAPSWQNGKTRERTWHGNGASTATRGNHSPKEILPPMHLGSLIGPLTLLYMARVLPSKPERAFFSLLFILVLSLIEKILNRGNSCIPDFVSTVSFILICLA